MTDRPAGVNEPFEIDTSRAHAARIYNYLLGGDDNFAADREAAQQLFGGLPDGVDTMRALARTGEAFLGRAMRYLAGEAGIRQFLNVGMMIPFGESVHDLAQGMAPDADVVYVVRDPLVLAHVHRLRPGNGEGATHIIHDELRDLPALMQRVAATLDLSRPLAVVLHGTLHFVSPPRDPYAVVQRLMGPTAPGSYLLVSHYAGDLAGGALTAAAERQDDLAKGMRWPFVPRSHADVTRFFEGLDLVEPGVVPVELWRPAPGTPPPDDRFLIPGYGAVARKPA